MIEQCLNCGKEIMQPRIGRRRKFCSADCRQKWWKEHGDLIQRKSTAYYESTCAYCGKQFKVYGNNHRKYCSNDCYVHDRFWRKEEFAAALECMRTGRKLTKAPLWLRECIERGVVK